MKSKAGERERQKNENEGRNARSYDWLGLILQATLDLQAGTIHCVHAAQEKCFWVLLIRQETKIFNHISSDLVFRIKAAQIDFVPAINTSESNEGKDGMEEGEEEWKKEKKGSKKRKMRYVERMGQKKKKKNKERGKRG